MLMALSKGTDAEQVFVNLRKCSDHSLGIVL